MTKKNKRKDLNTAKSRLKTISSFIFINLLRNIHGIVRGKIIAIVHGVSHVGILGQFISFNNLQIKLITFGTTASIVNSYNYAELNKIPTKQIYLINFFIILIANIINGIALIIGINIFSKIIYGDLAYANLIWLSILLNIIYSLSIFIELIFQAKKIFKELFIGRLLSLSISLILLIPLVYYLSFTGAIIGMIFLYIISFIYFSLKFNLISKINYQNIMLVFSSLNNKLTKYTLKVAATDFVRAIFVLGSLLIVRIYILHNFGVHFSGYYQAIISITNYINIIVEGFMIYYFPIIGSINKKENINHELNSNFEILIYLIFPIIILLSVTSPYLLNLLYSNEFIPYSKYLAILLVSKVFYVYYFFYTINFLAQGLLKKFFILESIKSIMLIVLTIIGGNIFGFIGAIYAIIIIDILSCFFVFSFLSKLDTFKLYHSNLITYVKMILVCLSTILLPFSTIYKLLIILFLIYILIDISKYKKVLNETISYFRKL